MDPEEGRVTETRNEVLPGIKSGGTTDLHHADVVTRKNSLYIFIELGIYKPFFQP